MRIQRLGQLTSSNTAPQLNRATTGPTISRDVKGPTLDVYPGSGGTPSILHPGDAGTLRVIEPENGGADPFPGGGDVIFPQDVGLTELFGGAGDEESFWTTRNKVLVGGGLAAAGVAAWMILRK